MAKEPERTEADKRSELRDDITHCLSHVEAQMLGSDQIPIKQLEAFRTYLVKKANEWFELVNTTAPDSVKLYEAIADLQKVDPYAGERCFAEAMAGTQSRHKLQLPEVLQALATARAEWIADYCTAYPGQLCDRCGHPIGVDRYPNKDGDNYICEGCWQANVQNHRRCRSCSDPMDGINVSASPDESLCEFCWEDEDIMIAGNRAEAT